VLASYCHHVLRRRTPRSAFRRLRPRRRLVGPPALFSGFAFLACVDRCPGHRFYRQTRSVFDRDSPHRVDLQRGTPVSRTRPGAFLSRGHLVRSRLFSFLPPRSLGAVALASGGCSESAPLRRAAFRDPPSAVRHADPSLLRPHQPGLRFPSRPRRRVHAGQRDPDGRDGLSRGLSDFSDPLRFDICGTGNAPQCSRRCSAPPGARFSCGEASESGPGCDVDARRSRRSGAWLGDLFLDPALHHRLPQRPQSSARTDDRV